MIARGNAVWQRNAFQRAKPSCPPACSTRPPGGGSLRNRNHDRSANITQTPLQLNRSAREALSSLTFLARLPEPFPPLKPNLLQQDPLEITILILPPLHPIYISIPQYLVVGLELIRQPGRVLVARERLGLEDEAPAGAEAAVQPREEGEQAGVERVEVDPLGD